MSRGESDRAAFIAGQQRPALTIPMAPVPLAANEIMALVVFGTLSESLFLIPMISESIRDCREVSMHHLIKYIRWIVRRYEDGVLVGLPKGIVQRINLFLKSIAKKFPFDKGAWVISAFKEILAKWEKMADKTYPKK